MKKLLLSLMCLGAMTLASAGTVTWTPSSEGYSNGQDIDVVNLLGGKVTLTLDKGSNNSNGPKYYTQGTAVRLYGGNTMTVTGNNGVSIVEVLIVTPSGNPVNAASTVTAGVLDITSTLTTWTGDAESFVFTQGGTSGHVRIQSMTITFAEPGEVVVAAPSFTPGSGMVEAGTEVALSCATEGAKIYYTVNGDEPPAASTLYTAPIAVNEDMTIKAVAELDGTLSAVAEASYFVKAGTGEGTLESPYDVEMAVTLIKSGNIPAAEVYVKGTVSVVTEISTQYGNATYTLSQNGKDLVVYRGKYFNGEAFPEDGIKEGDEVVVLGKLKDYNGTPEVDTGNVLISLNGESPEPEEPEVYVPVGAGTEEDPYTVADVQGLKIETSDGNKYWVVGYILGSVTNNKLNTTENLVDTNIALGATADAESFVPVALPSGDMRTALGVATNPNNIGKEVKVYGTLEKYFSTAGVKNVTEYAWVGDPAGIETIEAVSADAVYYNLQGVRVLNPAAGVFIRVQGNSATKVLVK